MRICSQIHEPVYDGAKRVEQPATGKLRPFCTSVKSGVGRGRQNGPLIHATSLRDARQHAKAYDVPGLAIQGELAFETDTDGNVLIAAFRAADHVTIDEIDAFVEGRRNISPAEERCRRNVIVSEVIKAVGHLGADSDLKAIIGSWGDTMSDEETMDQISMWNAIRAAEQNGTA